LEGFSIRLHESKTIFGFTRSFPFFTKVLQALIFHHFPELALILGLFINILLNFLKFNSSLGTFVVVETSFLLSNLFLCFSSIHFHFFHSFVDKIFNVATVLCHQSFCCHALEQF